LIDNIFVPASLDKRDALTVVVLALAVDCGGLHVLTPVYEKNRAL
jgi:hypothetical protein